MGTGFAPYVFGGPSFAFEIGCKVSSDTPVGDGEVGHGLAQIVAETGQRGGQPPARLELAAVPGHFLGTPDVARVLFRVAADADARLNLLLSGEGDALENVIPPMENQARIAARPAPAPATAPAAWPTAASVACRLTRPGARVPTVSMAAPIVCRCTVARRSPSSRRWLKSAQ